MIQDELRNRVCRKMRQEIKQAPQLVQDKWKAIEKLKGKMKAEHKKEFVMQWLSDPTWAVPIDISLSKYCLYKALPVQGTV